jgi:hypothetical protein
MCLSRTKAADVRRLKKRELFYSARNGYFESADKLCQRKLIKNEVETGAATTASLRVPAGSGAARRTQETHLRLPFFAKCYNSRVDHTS